MKKVVLFLVSCLVSGFVLAQPNISVAITSPADGEVVQRGSTVGITGEVTSDVELWSVYVAVIDEKNGHLVWSCNEPTVAGPFFCAWPVPTQPGRTYEIYANAVDSTQSTVADAEIYVSTAR